MAIREYRVQLIWIRGITMFLSGWVIQKLLYLLCKNTIV